MSQTAITFDETGFETQGAHNGVHAWFTPLGDEMGLFHYLIPADINADLHNVDAVRAFTV